MAKQRASLEAAQLTPRPLPPKPDEAPPPLSLRDQIQEHRLATNPQSKDRTMGVNFSDALNLAKSGERMRRAGWKKNDGTLVFLDGALRIATPGKKKGTEKHTLYSADQEDMLATDWDLERSLQKE